MSDLTERQRGEKQAQHIIWEDKELQRFSLLNSRTDFEASWRQKVRHGLQRVQVARNGDRENLLPPSAVSSETAIR